MLKNKTTGVFDAAKYLKHKVQSYEVGFLLDTEQKQIKENKCELILKKSSLGFYKILDRKQNCFYLTKYD